MTGHESHDSGDGEQTDDRTEDASTEDASTGDESTGDESTEDWRAGHTDLDSLRELDAVEVVEQERTVEREKFVGLRDRYRQIDGVVLVGITTDDGEVLLSGDDTWSPPGTSVEPGEDWAEAARHAMEALTGHDVDIDRPKLVELTEFRAAEDESARFLAPSVHFEASLAADAPAFRDDPTIADDVDDPYYEGRGIRWVDEVPADAHPNHEDHVELYLD